MLKYKITKMEIKLQQSVYQKMLFFQKFILDRAKIFSMYVI